jgi:hypothetical protein
VVNRSVARTLTLSREVGYVSGRQIYIADGTSIVQTGAVVADLGEKCTENINNLNYTVYVS